MAQDPDELLGAQLDGYLKSLESGDPLPDSDLAGEAAELQGLVGDLYSLARHVKAGSALGALEGELELQGSVGSYRLHRHLGQGGQSHTWLAYDLNLERRVVLKLYRAVEAKDERERVLREARVLSRVDSPFVARCHCADQHGDQLFLVLEHIAGTALDRYLPEQTLPINQIVELVLDVAQGLADVHACGLVHRDLKPANIVYGDDRRARIVDFGLAHIQATAANSIAGTPAYMAPEQARGELDRIDSRTDIFGLGAVLYELLSGRAPFQAASREESVQLAREGKITAPIELNRRVPRRLNRICMTCLRSEPVDRFATMEELISQLRNWHRQQNATRLVVLGAAALLCFGLVWWWQRSDRQPGEDFAAPTMPEPAPTISPTSAVNSQTIPQRVLDFFALDGHLRHDFWLEADILGAQRDGSNVLQLQEGDRLAFRIRSQRDCYVTILSYGADAPVQIFPNPQYDNPEDARVLAGQPKTIPNTDAPKSAWILAVPDNQLETLCVLAATRPISLGQNRHGDPRLLVDSPARHGQLRDLVRGLVRQPKSESHALSQLVVSYRVQPKP